MFKNFTFRQKAHESSFKTRHYWMKSVYAFTSNIPAMSDEIASYKLILSEGVSSARKTPYGALYWHNFWKRERITFNYGLFYCSIQCIWKSFSKITKTGIRRTLRAYNSETINIRHFFILWSKVFDGICHDAKCLNHLATLPCQYP